MFSPVKPTSVGVSRSYLKTEEGLGQKGRKLEFLVSRSMFTNKFPSEIIWNENFIYTGNMIEKILNFINFVLNTPSKTNNPKNLPPSISTSPTSSLLENQVSHASPPNTWFYTGWFTYFLTRISPKLIDEMFQKFTYHFVLSSSMVPPIYRKIHRTLDTKIFDYKEIKNIYLSWKILKFKKWLIFTLISYVLCVIFWILKFFMINTYFLSFCNQKFLYQAFGGFFYKLVVP